MATEQKTTARPSKATKSTSPALSPKRRSTSSATAPATRARASKTPIEQRQIAADERLRYIEVAAYYIAEKRGFTEGDPAQDWAIAEQQVDGQLLAGQLPA